MEMKPPTGRVEKQIVKLLLLNLQITGQRECVSITHLSRNFTGLRSDTVSSKIKSLKKKGVVVVEGSCVRLASSVQVRKKR
jgi:hypothetical protein